MFPAWFRTLRGPAGGFAAFLAVIAVGLLHAAPLSAQEEAVIQGRVTGPAGESLASAQITIPAFNLGTLTGSDGTYTLTVPAARVEEGEVTLQARLIGYRIQTAEIQLRPGAQITQNFTLQLDPIRLDEIVATGQGLQQIRRRLGSTLNTVSSEEVVQSQETNVVAALAGKAPNVEVTSSAGDPGAGAFIRIRGSNTLSGGNQPLFVVDGTPISNSSATIESTVAGTVYQNRAADLNPEDIQSIEILKGPAASAIYGAAGANGAVLITTKSGSRDMATQATLKTTYSFDEVTQLQPLHQRFARGLADPANPTQNLAASLPYSWGPELDCYPNCRLGTDVFDHASEAFETGNRFTGDLTLAGGADQTTWYLSGGYSTHDAHIVGPHGLDKLTARLKGSQMFGEGLTLGGNFAYTQQRGQLVQTGSNISGLLLAAYRTPPEFNNLPYLDPETGFHRSYRTPNPTSLASGRGYDNPFWIANEIDNQSDVDRTFGNVRADWSPLDWLSFQYTLGADYYTDQRFTVFPKSSSDFPNGRVVRADLTEFNVDHSLLATGSHTFTDQISGTLTVGQNLRHEEFRRFQVNGQTLIFGTDQLDFTIDRIPNEFFSKVRTEGYFATGELDLYDQLFLSGGLRMDASSTFGGEDVERFFYPQASVAWEFTQLEGLRDNGVLDYGKLRVAYGVAGKAPPVYSNVSSFQTTTITDGWLSPNGLETIYSGLEGVVSQGAQGNEGIEPERTWEAEGGVDLAFLDSRVSVGATYYYQRTEDAILFLPVAPSTGFTSRPQNGAEFQNKGIELTLDVNPVRMERFRWDVSAQWAKNDSEVLELLGAEQFGLAGFTTGAARVVKDICGPAANEACPFGVLYGPDWVRFGRGSTVNGVSIDEANAGWSAGDIYIGADGFPILDPQQRAIGDPNPDWTASIRNSFTVMNNLRISGLFDFKHGGDMWNGTKGALFTFGTHEFTTPMHGAGAQHVFGCGEPAMGEVGVCSNPTGVSGPGAGQEVNLNGLNWGIDIGGGFGGPTSQFIEDAGFVKLRDVTVSYTFDQDWVSKIGGASRIEVSAAGRNLKTWTDYTGQDPESNLTGQTTGRGLEYFNTPQTRSFVFQMSIVR